MEDGYNFKKLKTEILRLSKARDWEIARKEWAVVDIYDTESPQSCLCGHPKIFEICVIENRITDHIEEVGNVCVNRFIGFRGDLIFKALNRIRKDETRSLNVDAVTYFKAKGLLTDWEYEFLENTMRKRNLSGKQLEVRRQINKKVISAIARRGFQGPD